MLFTGLCTALVTPFRAGAVDYGALRRLIARQLEAGVPALLVCGTTGEASTLTEAEWCGVLSCAVETATGRARVIAGTGTNNLPHTLARARAARRLRADGQLVVTPYYNKTTQRGLTAYYARVAEETDLPMLLYNVPARTGLNLLPETAAALCAHPHIVGVKEAAGDLGQLARLLRLCPAPVYCGSDELAAPALRLGARGLISVASNVAPEALQSLCAHALRGCFATAEARQEALSPLISALFAETSPAPAKAALALLGLCREEVRSPLICVEDATRRRLQASLEALA